MALGTSTPTSTTVVEARMSISAFSKSVDDIILRLWRHLAMQHLNACTGNEAESIDRLRLDIDAGLQGLSCAAVLVNVEPGNVVDLLGRVLRRDHRADDVGLPALGQGISNRPIRDIAAAALERDRRNAPHPARGDGE